MNALIEHGIGILTKRYNNKLFIEIVMTGALTHEDYQLFIPILERALKKAKDLEVDLLVDASNFKGWKELQAMIDDASIGIKHLKDFDRVAVIGKKKWEEVAVKIWNFLTKSEVKYFKDREKALKWLLKKKK